MLETADFLRSFTPRLLHSRLNADTILGPRKEPLWATALFADLSGFSALSEQLAKRGVAGAEALSVLLNRIFAPLIRIISDADGDVIKFAGDALLAAWWAPVGIAEPDRFLRESLQLAKQCAAELIKTVRRLAKEEQVSLGIHIGIGAGPTAAFHVGGGYLQYECLLVGEAVEQACRAETQAKLGQIIVSEVAERAIALAAAIPSEMPSPGPAITPPPPTPEHLQHILRGYIPYSVLERLDGKQTTYLSELRRVTVLFVKLRGAQNLDIAELQAVTATISQVLARYEGSLNKLLLDDKGLILLAAFGLPPFSHEDDPARGLLAAIDLGKRLQRHSITAEIGVTSGRVFCGLIGGSQRQEYTLIGTKTNLAARLMAAASQHSHEHILCDEATATAVKDRIACTALPPISVKGFETPVAIFSPTRGNLRTVHKKQQVLGRRAEQAELSSALQRLLAGESSVVLVEGEAGIGKSWLIGELRQRAQEVKVVTLPLVAIAIEKNTPYYTIRSGFQALFNINPLDTIEAQKQQFDTWLESNPELAQQAPLLNLILPFVIPDNELTAQISGPMRQDSMRDLLVLILSTYVRMHRTLIILEDAHWCDSASWALLAELSRRVSPLLWLIVSRPFEKSAQKDLLEIQTAPGYRALRLRPLAASDIHDLVCQRLQVHAVPVEVIALLQKKAEGNPFFSEELAYALRDGGLLQIKDGHCELAPGVNLSQLAFPDTVQGIITSRIDHLSPPVQLALKVASVLGRIFAYRSLRDIYPILSDRDGLSDSLTTLTQADLTSVDTPEPDLAYVFKHVITQEVAYDLMLFAQRRELHRAAAEWYERIYAADLAPHFGVLAYHYGRAEILDKHIEYLEKSGNQALENNANVETIFIFAQLIGRREIEITHFRRAEWHTALGVAYHRIGKLAEAEFHLCEALRLLGHPHKFRTGTLALDIGMDLMTQLAHVVLPKHFVASENGLGRLTKDQERTLLLAGKIHETLGNVYFFSNHKPGMVYSTIHSTNLCEQTFHHDVRARAYAGMGVALGLSGLHAPAQRYQNLAEHHAQRTGHLFTKAYCDVLRSTYLTGLGNRWHESRNGLAAAIRILERLGDRHFIGIAYTMTAVDFCYAGISREGIEAYDRALALARKNLHKQHQGWALEGKGHVLLQQGHLAAARDCLQEAKLMATGSADNGSMIIILGGLALSQWLLGEHAAALVSMQDVEPIIAQSDGISFSIFSGYGAAAETLINCAEARKQDAWPIGDLLLRIERILRMYRRFCRSIPIGLSGLLYCLGRLSWLTGQHRRALVNWEQSLRAARRCNMPFEEARAHHRLALHSLSERDRRESARLAEKLDRELEVKEWF